jgi:nucleotide-binding universal stress UspA family protein
LYLGKYHWSCTLDDEEVLMSAGTDQPFRLLLVGVDRSEGSRRAVEWASLVARTTGAAVLAAHVLTYNQEFVRDLSLASLRTWRRELEHDLRTRWVDPLTQAGVTFRTEIVEGDAPAQCLLEIADREHADLVVVGARGHGNLSERVLGGVTYRLSHRARQAVVVVPPLWNDGA